MMNAIIRYSSLSLSLLLSGLSAAAEPPPNVLFIAIDDMNDWTTLFSDTNPIPKQEK